MVADRREKREKLTIETALDHDFEAAGVGVEQLNVPHVGAGDLDAGIEDLREGTFQLAFAHEARRQVGQSRESSIGMLRLLPRRVLPSQRLLARPRELKMRVHACDQLPCRKWLDDVVVGPRVEALYP